MLAVARDFTSECVEPKEETKRKQKKAASKRPERRFKYRVHENDNIEFREAIPIDESELDLCILMWQSVVVQALYDLANTDKSAHARLIRAEAASWFAGGSDLHTVLELAMLSRTNVIRIVKAVLNEGQAALHGFNFRTIRKSHSERIRTRKRRCSSTRRRTSLIR